MSEEKVIKLVKEELNITLDSMEIDKVKGDFSDPDDAINLGWVEGIKYALNVIERKMKLKESRTLNMRLKHMQSKENPDYGYLETILYLKRRIKNIKEEK
tara:strand:+ start:69 stop:368 length:300 start_codon:yes stop_codon:yes gene_type:complete